LVVFVQLELRQASAEPSRCVTCAATRSFLNNNHHNDNHAY
jgi:hypothetical protein